MFATLDKTQTRRGVITRSRNILRAPASLERAARHMLCLIVGSDAISLSLPSFLSCFEFPPPLAVMHGVGVAGHRTAVAVSPHCSSRRTVAYFDSAVPPKRPIDTRYARNPPQQRDARKRLRECNVAASEMSRDVVYNRPNKRRDRR